jgi:hypothetical protein
MNTITTVQDSLKYCSVSYNEPKKLSDLLFYLPLTTKFSYMQTQKDFAFCTLEPTRCMIVYRGTDNIFAFINDLECWEAPKKSVCTGIEEGFSDFAEMFLSWTSQHVQEARTAGVPIVATGHSRGAAACAVSGLLLRRVGLGFDHIDTFGEPLWCDGKVANEYDKLAISHNRYFTSYDIVPTLPFRAMGYVSVGIGHEIRTRYWLPFPPIGPLKYPRGIADHNLDKCYVKFGGDMA